MAVKIQISRPTVCGITQQRFIHPNHFAAFFVDGEGIEVVDLHIFLWLHGVRHRACVFHKLVALEGAYLANALDFIVKGIFAVLVFTENRKPFLEG